MKLDKTDHAILNELQKDSKRTFKQLSKIIKAPATTIHNRIKKLQKEKIIRNYKAVIDFSKADKAVVAFIFINIAAKKNVHEVGKKLGSFGCIEELFITTGSFDIIAKARFGSIEEFSQFLFDQKRGIKQWDSILNLQSTLAVGPVKEHSAVEFEIKK